MAEAVRSAKFDKKRHEILRAAARVFARLGFHRASLVDLGEELRVTPAALYYYAKSKDQLLNDCSDVALVMVREALEASQREGADGLARFRAFGRRHADIVCDDFGRCLVVNTANDLPPDLRRRNLAQRRSLNDTLRALIRGGIDDGSIRPCDDRLLASLLFNTINPMARWWSPKGPRSPAEIADSYLDMIVGGIGAADTGAQRREGKPGRRVRGQNVAPARSNGTKRPRRSPVEDAQTG
ncbi:MAG TPA: TetR/AcrR family transcriptional regulator [Vineibacter sp.]|nr:TetR/AcrR family transcriptional regulator [Vineibacter sp.]